VGHVRLAVALLLAVAGCAAPGSDRERTLTVHAASSLRDAMSELAAAYQERTGIRLSVSYDASSALRARLEQGAVADILASADERQPQLLAEAGLTAGAPVRFAANGIALVVPLDNPAGIEAIEDLAAPGVGIVAAGPDVPISGYVTTLIEQLRTEHGLPADLAARIERNVRSREDNVRAVAAKVELGEADAAFVYATDALASESLRTVALPPAAEVAVAYAAVVPSTARHKPDAAAFLAWLRSDEAQGILARFGFSRP
jgi:molybdate transport system substrate-binding protein